MKQFLWAFVLASTLWGCNPEEGYETISLVHAFVGNTELNVEDGLTTDVPVDRSISLYFSEAVDPGGENAFQLQKGNEEVEYYLTYNGEDAIIISPFTRLDNHSDYILRIERVLGRNGTVLEGVEIPFKTALADVKILHFELDGVDVLQNEEYLRNVSETPEVKITFNVPLSEPTIDPATNLSGPLNPQLLSTLSEDSTIILFETATPLVNLKAYTLTIDEQIKGVQGELFDGFEIDFYTQVDSSFKFPELSDEELLTLVQQQTFKYFWDFAHPTSGLIRERNTSGDLVTIGGSGFGVMAILVGIERGFISREEGISRLITIVNFLESSAARFHGVWPHWLSGSSGGVIPFSSNDDGGDLVETAFMIQALFTLRQYLDEQVAEEIALINTIQSLIDQVEWDWYTQGGKDALYWHWSPNFGWEKNMAIRGWNEALIVYVLAASSTTHTIDRSIFEKGWARSGSIVNSSGNRFYGYRLPMRSDKGGPLFFAHYSFLGLDPRNLEDQYANYWEQNVTHTQINRAYCIDNPMGYPGYGESSWGLTASDGNDGYSAHSPDRDKGVITPTAAISSLPYTPEYSMEAIRYFYYILGDKIWGSYGFYDAYNVSSDWYARSYLAIDQGPIICMIENYRSALLWDLFMSAPEIQDGLTKLGFTF